jgi:arylsulfatase A-like enzyme
MQKFVLGVVVVLLGSLVFFLSFSQGTHSQQVVDTEDSVAVLPDITKSESSIATPDQPNIILFMSDDQGWGQVGYNGHPELQTPVLDELSRTGVRFDNFYVNASVCAPTRYGVLTGLQPSQNGCFTVEQCRLEPETTTIAEVLRDAGYRTAHFGKWHLGNLRDMSDTSPKEHGFMESYTAPNFFDSEPDVTMYHNGKKEVVDLTGIDTSVFLADKVNNFIEEYIDEPLFIVVWFPSPHSPYIAQSEYKSLYSHLSEEEQNKYGEITAMDKAIGSVQETLIDAGLYENTLLWFNSDNGAPAPRRNPVTVENGGLRDGKNSLYEGGVRVPAIVNWPETMASRISNDVIGSLDMFATIASLAGVSNLVPTNGVDLSELLLNQQSLDRSEYYILYDLEMKLQSDIPNASAAVIQYPYKLVRPKAAAPYELYNLKLDQSESQNLIVSESIKAAELQTLLETWLSAQ